MADNIKLSAMKEALKSSELTPEEKTQLQTSVQNDYRYALAAKGLLLAAFVFIPDWKKQVPIYKRHIPMAAVAVLGCTGIDYAVREYFWKQNEEVVKRITGFNGEVYLSSEGMKSMKQMYKSRGNADKQGTKEEDLLEE